MHKAFRHYITGVTQRAFGPGVAKRAKSTSAEKLPPHPHDSFLNGTNASYVEQMHAAWRRDPNSVHASWQAYFSGVEAGKGPSAFTPPPSIQGGANMAAAAGAGISGGNLDQEVRDHLAVLQLIRGIQVNGHRTANLDPLGFGDADLDDSIPPDMIPETFGLHESDMNRKFNIASHIQSGFMGDDRVAITLGELMKRLHETYCNNIGVDYMHLQNHDELNWIRSKVETPQQWNYTVDEKLVILDRLIWSDYFERFLAHKWSTAKRFGLEGAEALIPGMKAMIDTACDHGVDTVVMGMPHRGRLNVLANVVRKPLEQIFGEFSGESTVDDDWSGSGDVKYHLGTSFNRTSRNGKPVHLSLLANPSHLECVNPVVMGKARAKQYYKNDKDRTLVLPLLLHGDAAFAGQGVVYESMGFSGLHNYMTGGTIHLVVNNQIGFTTDPRSSRTTPYCTDIAKAFSAPVFHVNGDDPEAVVFVCQLAAEWRQKFHKDVVVDMVCYRRHGHNELDQPMFTQPAMYKVIKKHPSTLEIYKKKLMSEGSLTEGAIKDLEKRIHSTFEQSFKAAQSGGLTFKKEWLASPWQDFKSPAQLARIRNTGVPRKQLETIGEPLTTIPEDFKPHKKIGEIYNLRKEMFSKGSNFDWGTAEALAFATLLAEGNHVRLSGQDVERGTFSHRHAVIHDQENSSVYVPLNNISPDQQFFQVCNSSLSEFGVLGFEEGYAMENPNSLVMWEAQFGDFANTAQCIIDQFIASGEQKWHRQSGLTMLLPHGYEGQGPEHSSARVERFLQMVDDNPYEIPNMDHESRNQIQNVNWQIIAPTTPANYFHALRRQVHREFRKPLVVINPKSLLRHPKARSTLDDMDEGTRFLRAIADGHVEDASGCRRLIMCSGKVYYDLENYREKEGINDVAILRIEQIAPFPYDHVQKEVARFPNAEIVWVQEEPLNMGAFSYVEPRIETALKSMDRNERARYIGRAASASPATGSHARHMEELHAFVTQAFE